MQFKPDNKDLIERWAAGFALAIGLLAPTLLVYLLSLHAAA